MAKVRSPIELGRTGEELALKYLQRKKYRILSQRFRFMRGEIDIIAEKDNTLVFIEVKTRRNTKFGFPEEAVTQKKQKQIRRIAQGYLARYNKQDAACRFDVLSVLVSENNKIKIDHFVNAFE